MKNLVNKLLGSKAGLGLALIGTLAYTGCGKTLGPHPPPPTPNKDSISVIQGIPKTLNLKGGETHVDTVKAVDAQGKSLNYTLTKGPSWVSQEGNGNIVYEKTPNNSKKSSEQDSLVMRIDNGSESVYSRGLINVDYNQPPTPKPGVLNSKNLNEDEQIENTNILSDTLENGHNYKINFITDNSGLFSILKWSGNKIISKSEAINSDRDLSWIVNYTDLGNNLTSSDTIKVKLFDHPSYSVGVADFNNLSSLKQGVLEVGIDSAGVYVPYNNIIVFNGKKLTDSIGRTAIQTGSNNEADIMLGDRTDSLSSKNYIGLWMKMGEGSLIKYPSSQAYNWDGNMNKTNMQLPDLANAPAPSESYVGKISVQLKDSNGLITVGVVPYKTGVVNYQNASFTPLEARSFFGNTNAGGGLIKNNVENVSLIKYDSNDTTIHFDSKEMGIAEKVIKGLSDARVNAGGKPLTIYEDSVANSAHSGNGWWDIVPVKPGSKYLYYNNNILATSDNSSQGLGNGSVTWIEYNLDKDAPSQDSTTLSHEGALSVEGSPFEIANSTWSEKTITEASTKLTKPGPIDLYWMPVTFSNYFKAGTPFANFGWPTFNWQDTYKALTGKDYVAGSAKNNKNLKTVLDITNPVSKKFNAYCKGN